MNDDDEDTTLAAAYLSRITEPVSLELFRAVAEYGLVGTAARVRARDVPAALCAATEARWATADPAADLEAAARCGITLLTPASPDWPHFGLAALYSVSSGAALVPPIALWAKGRTDLLSSAAPVVALVGSRAATEYGSRIAADMAYGLARDGVLIVSGGAYGIDAAAHRGALAAAGSTLLFSAAGLDRAYPAGNRSLFERVAAEGVVVSEYPPGCAPQRHRFLARNRLIAAFAQATVVVEAALRSGALNTAAHARRLGKPVLAVPGPVTSAQSAGCHELIRRDSDAAHLVTSSEDVLPFCGSFRAGELTPDQTSQPQEVMEILDPASRRVLEGFPTGRSVTPRELARLSGRPISDVNAALPSLCALGLVLESSSGYRRSALARTRHRRG